MTNARQIPEGGCARLELTEPYFCMCPAFVRSSRVKIIRRSNSDRAVGVEKTRLIKHSMVTDTQARRIITVSNIDQVIFFLNYVNALFLSGHNTASKMQRSYDSRYNRPC